MARALEQVCRAVAERSRGQALEQTVYSEVGAWYTTTVAGRARRTRPLKRAEPRRVDGSSIHGAAAS